MMVRSLDIKTILVFLDPILQILSQSDHKNSFRYVSKIISASFTAYLGVYGCVALSRAFIIQG